MKNNGRKSRLANIVIFTLLSSLLALLIIIIIYPTFQREPEIRISALVAEQVKSLPDYWDVGNKTHWEIQTDTDLTYGSWALYMDYEYQHGYDKIRQEVHVSSSPIIAKIQSNGIYLGEDINKPEEWSFRPKYADYFEIGCERVGNFYLTCTTILRYKEFIFVINTPIRKYMRFDDLEDFLLITDQYMQYYLNNSSLLRNKVINPTSIDDIW